MQHRPCNETKQAILNLTVGIAATAIVFLAVFSIRASAAIFAPHLPHTLSVFFTSMVQPSSHQQFYLDARDLKSA
jgi:hypothetical protein